MVTRPLFLVRADEFLSRPAPLPDHAFRIGEDGQASLNQLPNFRLMAFHVIGKAPVPMSDGSVDTVGMGVYALGLLIGDAYLKLKRPWPVVSGGFEPDVQASEIQCIADGLLPLSPKAEPVRDAFLMRIETFNDIALNNPCALNAIAARIDALSNARLTERAAVILRTGIDPGADDLWPNDPARWQP